MPRRPAPSTTIPLSLLLALVPPTAASAQTAAQTPGPIAPRPPLPGAAPSSPAPPAQPVQEDITVTGRTPAVTKALPGGRDFISPMGEPFHSADDLSGAEHWFRQADENGNGSLTLEEFKADGAQFFAKLDTDHDGDIGPMEIEHYEEVVAPEVKAISTFGDPSKIQVDQDGKVTPAPYPDRIGAGRYGYLSLPEPVVYADSNFDRAVSKLEFAQAAEKRFKMLDVNADGGITRDELPKPGR